MPLTALLLVLTAAVLHASWNIVAKRAGGNHHFALLCSALIALLWLPVALWFGVQELAQWSLQAWGLVGASAVLHLLYFNSLLAGYRAADLTVVYPVARGSAPLVSVLGAVLLLGERPSLLAAAGVAGVCGGVFLIAGGPSLWRMLTQRKIAHAPDAALARQRLHAGLRWGALTGLLIAGYTLVDGYAVKVLLIGPVLLDYMGNLLRLPFLLSASLHQRSGLEAALRSQWRAALVVALISPLGYVLVLYALKTAPLSQVAPLREVSMLLAALVGGKLLAEGDRGARVAGALCIAAGAVALGWG